MRTLLLLLSLTAAACLEVDAPEAPDAGVDELPADHPAIEGWPDAVREVSRRPAPAVATAALTAGLSCSNCHQVPGVIRKGD